LYKFKGTQVKSSLCHSLTVGCSEWLQLED